MTKLKSKKMTKSTLAIIIMGIAIVALLAFGGSFAYFTAKSTQLTSSAATTGKVIIANDPSHNTIAVTTSGIVPGSTIVTSSADVKLTNSSTVNTYIAVKMIVTYSGDYYTSNGSSWGSVQNGTVQLTDAEMNSAFGGTITLATPASNYTWEQGTSDAQAFILKGTGEGHAAYVIPSTVTALTVLDSGSTVSLSTSVNRYYENGTLQLPEAGANDAHFFVWENASITISIQAYQTQADNIGTSSTTADAIWADMTSAGYSTNA